MAKIKLPAALSDWKVLALVSDTDEGEIYSLVNKNDDSVKAKLAYYEFADELYNQEDIDFIKDEAGFVNTVRALRTSSTIRNSARTRLLISVFK